MAILGANSDPMRRELIAAQRLAASTGVSIKSSLGDGFHANSGVIRETVVLLREIGRGNWSRVPGSLTILMQRLGLLNLIVKENVAATILQAAADEKAAQKAALVALASTRKAAASQEAMYACEGEGAAELETAVADEEKAAADILAAKSAQAKAAASREAAAATELEGAASTFSFAPLGMLVTVLAAVAVAAYVVYEKGWKPMRKAQEDAAQSAKDLALKMSESVEGIKDATEAAQKYVDTIREIEDAHESMAESVDKSIAAMREQHELEKAQAKANGATPQQLAAMDKKEAQAEIAGLQQAQKESQAVVARDKAAADAAEANLEKIDKRKNIYSKEVFDAKQKEAQRQLSESLKQFSEDSKSSDAISSKLSDAQGSFGIRNKFSNFGEFEKQEKERGKNKWAHGEASDLQRIGAYNGQASLITEAKRTNSLLAKIVGNTNNKIGSAGTSRGLTGVAY